MKPTPVLPHTVLKKQTTTNTAGTSILPRTDLARTDLYRTDLHRTDLARADLARTVVWPGRWSGQG